MTLGYSDVDIASLTYEDIRILYDCYSSVEVGKTRNPNGTYHRDTKLVCHYKTKIGEIREEDYDKIALEVIEKNNDRWILDRLFAHTKTFPFLRTESEQFHYAIDLTISKVYEEWIKRGEFSLSSDAEPGQLDIFKLFPECNELKSEEEDIEI